MFIHWGLYSELAGVWENKRYYAIGEWIAKSQVLYFEALKTGDERYHFRDHQIGIVYVQSAGIKELSIKPIATGQNGEFIQLQRVKLIPL
jgi:hypothetical protein